MSKAWGSVHSLVDTIVGASTPNLKMPWLDTYLAPALALLGLSLLVYGEPGRLQSMGGEAARYISLAHAVLGAVMFGWGLLLVALV